MINNNILSLYQALNKVGNLRGAKFAYAIARNLAILEPEIKSIQKASAPKDDYIAYEKERIELAKKHAEKDEKGKPKTTGNSYDITDMEAFTKELETLKQSHKEAIDAYLAQGKEVEKLLQEETKIELFQITEDDIPKEITVEQLQGIYLIIK